jgi:dCTP deaminase
MMLSDRDIGAALADGSLTIDPFDPACLQPASVDVRLSPGFRVFHNHSRTHIDPATPGDDLTELVTVKPGDPFILHPGEFVLGCTVERFAVPPDMSARLEGKSSLGRLGLLVHSTAGFVDPGFRGALTLELSSVARLPILLWPGMRIGQLCVFRLSSPAECPYGTAGLGSRYQDQSGPTASRM